MFEDESEVNNAEETTGFVDEVLGGVDESHSLETTEQNKYTAEQDGEIDELLPDDDDELFESTDSGKEEEKEPPVDTTALRQEIDGLKKRLHDTQSAMHKATTERAQLQKELDDLKEKRDNEDDWFDEDDNERLEVLEKQLKNTDDEINRFNSEGQEIEKKTAAAEWDEAAAPVIAKHKDFNETVYGGLVPLLDETNGNAHVRAEWARLGDYKPATIYAFAKRMLDIVDFQKDPDAYKARLRKSTTGNEPFTAYDDSQPVGKSGLDMVQSADYPVDRVSERNVSFVDAVFG